ncbi:archease [Halovenus rubra]|uniref:Archease n=2 Tax=Halovenus rubra TaxID=869890 RepID=A0ABD5X587_9EURY|nr:archease [Halovenus rubra]
MPYELCEHTADVAVEATGATLAETFASVADGMTAAMCESVPAGGERHTLDVRAESRDAVLFDYLDELIYERDVRAVLPVENRVTIQQGDDWSLSGSYRGVSLSAVTARDLKAVTYSEMEIAKRESSWFAYVVFDV